ncbi:hypothetical protein CR513_50743, partial [Mucuna pruriens]
MASLHSNRSKYTSTGEFGDSLGAFRDSVLGKLTREDEANRGLDLAGGNGRLLVVASKSRRFLSELLKDIVDEAVHDPHGLAGDPDVRVHLLQNLEYVNLVSLHTLRLLLLLFVARGRLLWYPLLRLRLLRRSLLRGLLLRRFLLTLGHGLMKQ